jgi:hypothetical protein
MRQALRIPLAASNLGLHKTQLRSYVVKTLSFSVQFANTTSSSSLSLVKRALPTLSNLEGTPPTQAGALRLACRSPCPASTRLASIVQPEPPKLVLVKVRGSIPGTGTFQCLHRCWSCFWRRCRWIHSRRRLFLAHEPSWGFLRYCGRVRGCTSHRQGGDCH